MPEVDLSVGSDLLSDVPPELIRYTCGFTEFDRFQNGGRDVFYALNLAAQRYGGKPIHQFERILDFGCGAGRLAQFIKPGPEVHACDVNGPLIDFLSTALPGINPYHSPLNPPLKYADNTFDLVYSFSVFSHLTQEIEQQWLAELNRVGRPGCLYLLTHNGDWVIQNRLNKDETDAAHRAGGFYLKKVHGRTGGDMDFPDYYEASYHTSDFIRREWGKTFDVLAIIKGDSPANYLWDNLAFQPQGIVPAFRPLGQCVAVMRKK